MKGKKLYININLLLYELNLHYFKINYGEN